jgi:hypothetical protein
MNNEIKEYFFSNEKGRLKKINVLNHEQNIKAFVVDAVLSRCRFS